MNINLLTQEQQDTIKKADELLASAGLPTFTDTTASLCSAHASSRNLDVCMKDSDKLTAKLLDSALRHLRNNNNPEGARILIQSVRDSLIVEDDDATL